MAISNRVRQELKEPMKLLEPDSKTTQSFNRDPLSLPASSTSDPVTFSTSCENQPPNDPSLSRSGHARARVWSEEEHKRFIEALAMHPAGPWKAIAVHIGSKTVRQVMSHAQKYRQKLARRKRGLKKTRQRRKRSISKSGSSAPKANHLEHRHPHHTEVINGGETRALVCSQSSAEVSKHWTELGWSPVVYPHMNCPYTSYEHQLHPLPQHPRLSPNHTQLHLCVDHDYHYDCIQPTSLAGHRSDFQNYSDATEEVVKTVSAFVNSFDLDNLDNLAPQVTNCTMMDDDEEDLLWWFLFG